MDEPRRSLWETLAAQTFEEWIATLFFVFVLIVLPILLVFGAFR